MVESSGGLPSSSKSFSGGQLDFYNQLADQLEVRLVRNLSTSLSDTVQSVFAMEVVKLSASFQMMLSNMEHELMRKLSTKLATCTPMSMAPYSSGSSAASVRSSVIEPTPQANGLVDAGGIGPLPSFGPEASDGYSFTGFLSEPSSGTPRRVGKSTPEDAPVGVEENVSRWKVSMNATRLLALKQGASGQSKAGRASVEDIGSLEQRLATDIIAAKLGKHPNGQQSDIDSRSSRFRSPQESADAYGLRLDPVVSTNYGEGGASSSSQGPSSAMGMKPTLSYKASTPMSFKRCERMSMANLQGEQWDRATRSFYGGQKLGGDNIRRSTRLRQFVGLMPRLLGMIPWSPDCRYFSRLYQALVVIVTTLAASELILDVMQIVPTANEATLVNCINIVICFGSLLGLSSCLIHNKAIVNATALLESYASRADFCLPWDKRSTRDYGLALVGFALCIGVEIGLDQARTRRTVHCAVAFITLLILALCFHLLRLCRGLCYIIDMFCNYMMENTDFTDAVQEWYLLHATSRSVCTSFQLCFVVLQSAAIGTLSFATAAVYVGVTSDTLIVLLPRILPGVLCAIAIVNLSMCASAFTHKCNRVPMIVNSAALDELDPKRMYLVEYIVKSQAGFYIFDVQLSSGILLKIFYVACAAAFAFTTRALT